MIWIPISFFALQLASSLYAFTRGGAPERLIGALLIVGAILSPLVQNRPGQWFATIEVGIMAVDAAMMAVGVVVALVSARYWTMIMAGFLVVQVLSHLTKLLAPDLLPAGYFSAEVLWGFPMQALIAVGTLRHRARLAHYGVDHAWTRSLPANYLDGQDAGRLRPNGAA